jgi:type IV secretion system protein VirB10
MAPQPPLPRLITSIPPGTRQNKRILIIAGAALALAGVGGIALKFGGNRPALSREPRDRPISEQVITEGRATLPEDLRLPSSYARQALPPTPAPDPTPTVPREPTPRVQPVSSQPSSNGYAGTPRTEPVHTAATEHTRTVVKETPTAQAQQTTTQPAPKKEPPKRWFSKETTMQGDILTPPFPDEKNGQQGRQSALFPQAIWETPADPTKVLYADQVVHGLLMQSLNSDIPGTVRIKATETVYDRFGQRKVLIPMDTTFLGRQEGKPQYGDERVPVTITMAILPNGTAIQWKSGQAGDATGATGIPGKVHNHYGSIILGAGLSALLNIGTRAPFGSPSNFQQNLPQEFAQDTAQSLGQSVQGIVQRELNISPTITAKYATPVTLQFGENVSFQTKPLLVTK